VVRLWVGLRRFATGGGQDLWRKLKQSGHDLLTIEVKIDAWYKVSSCTVVLDIPVYNARAVAPATELGWNRKINRNVSYWDKLR
jgi:hypothetical protein